MTEETIFKQVLIELYDDYFKQYENIGKSNNVVFSKKHKRKVNRINREIIGGKKAIYPEVDNIFQRCRSKVARVLPFLKIKNKR